ncbi:MAG: DUF4954 family protein [Saprospiraceae bacterium]
MNLINKVPLENLGYGYIADEFIPKGKNEYYLRDQQHKTNKPYRRLKGSEIEILVHNNNASNDWNEIRVSEEFNPQLVKHCQFYGQVRIGKLEPFYLDFHNLKLPVGLYDSTICSCDLGDNVVLNNVGYIAHYIVGDQSILVNVNEITATDFSKFGNGIIKQGEHESSRIWLEICNENGGRKVMPFDGMLPADAWIWAKYRNRTKLMNRFKSFTEKVLDDRRGYYGYIGNFTVIKNCRIIKDVRIGDHAYLKGANKLKNMTINSSAEAPSQIGEGAEMVNGIMEVGCRAFYGIKAIRFFMASHSNLKYGARLINSYLGSNATVSCCEVLNSLIYPAHEQHHNTSFLIASTLMGQSNVAAGATIGSNHNSRGADGELIAGRGFWPGLSVTLKHNSRFASFTLMIKGNYQYEIDLKIPFCIVSNDESKNELVLYPGYWFDHNLFALARNTHKFRSRDSRHGNVQPIEYEYLAPDSVEEMTRAILYLTEKMKGTSGDLYVDDIENNKRKTRIRKPVRAIEIFTDLINYYLVKTLIEWAAQNATKTIPEAKAHQWTNLGGQLVTTRQLNVLLQSVEKGSIGSWTEVHDQYIGMKDQYHQHKLEHALACYCKVFKIKQASLDWKLIIQKAVLMNDWILSQIIKSKSKDFVNPFRKMMYDTQEEMDSVLGTMDDIPFLNAARQDHLTFALESKQLLKKLKLLK